MKQKETAPEDMPMEDFLAELERMDRAPWPRRLWYYRRSYLFRPWNTLKELRWKLGNFWQRGRRGWADNDVWYMDIYLAEVISEMLTHLAEHHYGVPFPFSADEENLEAADERWTTWLRTMAETFSNYKHYMESDESYEDKGNVRHNELMGQMRTLFDHYSKLGD